MSNQYSGGPQTSIRCRLGRNQRTAGIHSGQAVRAELKFAVRVNSSSRIQEVRGDSMYALINGMGVGALDICAEIAFLHNTLAKSVSVLYTNSFVSPTSPLLTYVSHPTNYYLHIHYTSLTTTPATAPVLILHVTEQKRYIQSIYTQPTLLKSNPSMQKFKFNKASMLK